MKETGIDKSIPNEIWKNFCEGDHSAYSFIYNHMVQDLFCYGMKIVNNRELVKDSIQDVFIKIYQNKTDLHTIKNIKCYFMIALKHTLYRNIEKENIYTDIPEPLFHFSTTYSVEDIFINNEENRIRNEKLINLINNLPARQREVLYYRYIENMEFDEICKIMELNYQSLHNLIQRSLKKAKENVTVESFLLYIALYHIIY